MMEKLSDILARQDYLSKVESPIEWMLVSELRRFGAKPQSQYVVHGIRCDIGFPERKLIVECDGKEFHKDKLKDQARDKILEDRGWTVVRVTGSEIVKKRGREAAFKIITDHFRELLENPNYLGEIEKQTYKPRPEIEEEF